MYIFSTLKKGVRVNIHACMWTEGPGEPHQKLLIMTAQEGRPGQQERGDGAGGD